MDFNEVTLSFERSVANGRHYWNDIASGGQETRWLHMDDLTSTESDDDGQETSPGWTKSIGSSHRTVFDLRKAYNALNISGSEDANYHVRLDQDEDFKTLGTRQPATYGVNENEYNVAGKTIAGSFNKSPKYKLRQRLRVEKLSPEQALGLPQVKFWSDIVWIVWANLAKTAAEASMLKYVFKHDVVTRETVFVIEHIFDVGSGKFPNGGGWPGVKLVPYQDNFWAVLGTPHGRGIANLIRDHPNELPGKTVESINVFRGDNNRRHWHLLFTLDGPKNTPLEPSDLMTSSEDDSDSNGSMGEPDTKPTGLFERSGDITQSLSTPA